MKKYLFGFITSFILVCGIYVFAESIDLDDILFKPKDKNWNVSNVRDALDGLYNDVFVSDGGGYVKDGLVMELDSRYSGLLYSNNISKDEEGYVFTEASWIYFNRFQNPTMTYETYFKPEYVDNSIGVIVSSTETGGCSIYLKGGYIYAEAYIDGGYKMLQYDVPYEIGKWYHVVGSFGINGMKLYVNGELVDQNEFSGIKPSDSSTITMIGAEPVGSGYNGQYFIGKIKKVRIYDRGLTYAEVIKNYNNTKNN